MAAVAVAPMGFACVASGSETIAPVTTAEACARVRVAVERAIGAPLRDEGASGIRPGIRVALTFGAVIAKAEVTDLRGATARPLPILYESSVDRSHDAGVVDTLAAAIGAALTP